MGSPKKYRPIPHYPSTTRDIALLVDEHITYQQVYDTMKDSPLVTEVTPFNLYSGEQTAGKKSLAFIEEGKIADMVVWSHDLYSMYPQYWRNLKAEITLVGGKVVYKTEGSTLSLVKGSEFVTAK